MEWTIELSDALRERLEPEATLSAGAGGLVVRCREVATGRPVVLKHSRADSQGDPVLNKRFLREARALAGVDHPGVLKVLECGEDLGARYLLLEYLDGPTLAELVESRGPLPVGQAARAAGALFDALAVVHAQGILHRDLKPANAMLVSGRGLVLIDFGIARTLLDSQSLTATGTMVGTPAFLAPEVIRGDAAAPAADLYAAALVLHFLLLGRPTFARPKIFETLEAQLSAPPEPVPRAPPALVALLGRWLAKEPAARPPPDAAAWRSALADAIG